MITTKQKWILGGLLAASAGVWTPQLMQRASSDSKAQLVLDGPTEAEMLEIDAEVDEMDVGGGSGGTRRPAQDRRPGQVDGPDEIVGSILGALGTSDVFSGEARHRTLQEIADDWARQSGDGLQEQRTPLAIFLDENPFGATMVGANSRVAMLGPYTVHEGDEIPGTDAHVVEIDSGGIVIESGGMTVEIDLPPLRASEMYALDRAAARRRVTTPTDESVRTPEGDEQ